MAPLLLVLLPVQLLLAVANAVPYSCAKAICGGQDIHYPFWLNSSAPGCGYPGIGLVCEDDNTRLILPFKSHRYVVFSIDYKTHTVLVADEDIVDEYAAGCPRLHVNLTIDTVWLRLAPSDSNITFLYSCKKNITLSSAVELSGCQQQQDGGSDDRSYSYVLRDGGITGAEAYEYECEEVVVAPVLDAHKKAVVGASGGLPLGNGSFREVLQGGFELSYDTHSEQCDRCEGSGGWCGYQSNETHPGGVMRFTCFCDGGSTTDRCDQTADVLGNTSSSCGYPGLAIDCVDDKYPTMQLGSSSSSNSDSYNVTGIDYNNFTISLADPDVVDDESCPRVDHNVTVPSSFWLNLLPEYTVGYLLFFTNCSISSLPGQPDIQPITCASYGGGYSFVIPLEVPHQALSQECKEVALVPVLQNASAQQIDQQWNTTSGYGNILRQGFQLELNLSRRSEECTKCERSSGRCVYSRDGEFEVCFCINGRTHDQECTSGSKGKKGIITDIVAGTSSLLFLCLVILTFFLACKYEPPLKSKDEPRIESFLQKNGNLHPKRYTYADVKRMTKSFAVKLGQGGFGAVYRGNLYDGRQVAIKMLKDTKGDGEEFMNEVASISRTSHVNVVTLLGFCLQGSKRALIYEYMPNGSLERYAFNTNMNSENSLSWKKLFDIAIGTARGLEYLHRGCNTRIVHFDIKPHNILLDQDFCPKISDFGLAKLCLNKESAISIVGARGTIGYIAPEVFSKQFGIVSSKSDVYSYGMMVLEMVGVRDKNTSANSESSSQYFPQWIYEHLDDYCISASEIDGKTTELVRKMIVVGLWCIQLIPSDRPTMTRVVEMLEGGTGNLELPPKVLLS